jgi:diaminopimelate epimerase
MTVFNADGSRPEMCGNGLRCVAAALGAGTHDVATDAGLRRCAVVGAPRAQDGFEVTVDMGVARREEDLRLRLDDRDIVFLRVDMGNPHAVTFEVSGERALADFGRRVATSIPGGVNAEFCARNAKDEVEVLVWERGVGPTLACGTGACAVAFAACEIGLTERGREQAIRLPGGLLSITVLADARVRMKGPARRVFEGTFAPL